MHKQLFFTIMLTSSSVFCMNNHPQAIPVVPQNQSETLNLISISANAMASAINSNDNYKKLFLAYQITRSSFATCCSNGVEITENFTVFNALSMCNNYKNQFITLLDSTGYDHSNLSLEQKVDFVKNITHSEYNERKSEDEVNTAFEIIISNQ